MFSKYSWQSVASVCLVALTGTRLWEALGGQG